MQSGVVELVKYVLEHDIDIDAKDVHGWSQLHYACGDWFHLEYYSGSIGVVDDLRIRKEIASVLIAHVADINTKDKKGESPLRKAIKMRFHTVVDLLRQHGAKK